ncbi:MAG: hypothetical protein HY959_02565 [Ignavibacteriae bacterium]|nr:hypothetical protein [Ignavibacteriota bacterium]
MKPQGQAIVMYIGIIIGGLGFLLGAGVAIIAAPIPGTIFTAIFIIIFGLTFGRLYLRNRTRNRLLRTGRRARGKIIEVWDTGVTINNQPQIGMIIEVKPDTEMPFKAEVKQVISRLQTFYYQVGKNCIVRYDQNDKSTVAIESLND